MPEEALFVPLHRRQYVEYERKGGLRYSVRTVVRRPVASAIRPPAIPARSYASQSHCGSEGVALENRYLSMAQSIRYVWVV